jgi:hypothetical protein
VKFAKTYPFPFFNLYPPLCETRNKGTGWSLFLFLFSCVVVLSNILKASFGAADACDYQYPTLFLLLEKKKRLFYVWNVYALSGRARVENRRSNNRKSTD